MPGDDNYFNAPLKKAVEDGQVPMARLDDMVHRILRSMFAAGVVDDPPVRTVVDPFRGRDDAQHIAEESIVLLKNSGSILPLKSSASNSIALIGSHADVGVLSGGGSAQVDAPGGNAANPQPGGSNWGEASLLPFLAAEKHPGQIAASLRQIHRRQRHRRGREPREVLHRSHRLRQPAHARRPGRRDPLSARQSGRTR